VKRFFISTFPDTKFVATVIATGAARPSAYLREVEATLAELGHEGTVLFDLLLANGSSSQRYFTAAFDGAKLHCLLPAGDAALRAKASKFFAKDLSNHFGDLDTSMLTPAMRFAVSRGRAI
jgi:Antitoxin to bacterial toxin RNase LS or RnlA